MISLCARTKFQCILKPSIFPRMSLTKEFVNLNKIQTKHKPGLVKLTNNVDEKKWNSNYEEKDRILTIPNLLCMGRIVVSPYLATIIINGDYKTSLIVYSIAGFTDLVRYLFSLDYYVFKEKIIFIIDLNVLSLFFSSMVILLVSFLDKPQSWEVF